MLVNLFFFVAVIEKIAYAKAVINKIGAGAEGVFKLAGACFQ
jgi:hypothetical protein